MIMSAKWELASDLEEHAYRWRQGRMADLGYVDFYEALSIYRWLDPASVKLDEQTLRRRRRRTRRPSCRRCWPASLDEARLLRHARSATLPSDADVERLHAALVLLINKAMAADPVDPGDFDAGQATRSRAPSPTSGLGLEYLARGDATRAGQALRRWRWSASSASAVSLTLQLKTLAETLVAKGGVDPIALDAPWDDVMLALRQRRPEYPRALDAPPAEGTRPSPRSPTSRAPRPRSKTSRKTCTRKNGNSLRTRAVRRYKNGATSGAPTRMTDKVMIHVEQLTEGLRHRAATPSTASRSTSAPARCSDSSGPTARARRRP